MSAETVIQQEVAVQLPNGLHMRPLSHIARVAGGYACEVTIRKGDQTASAKSPLDMMALNAPHGTTLILEARGDSAAEALAAIIPFLEKECDDSAD